MSAEFWDRHYTGEDYFFGTEPNDFLRENAGKIPKGGQVLCLGAGEGRNAVFLAELGFEVTAIDRSGVGIRKMELLARKRRVELEAIHADLAFQDLGRERWDGIVSIWAHFARDTRISLHRSCVESLKPGGVFLLEAYTSRQLEIVGRRKPDAGRYMTRVDLMDELSGLVVLHAAELDRRVLEGQAHPGQGVCAVVQIVATRPK